MGPGKRDAFRKDARAAALARGRAPLELALGEVLARLSDGGLHLHHIHFKSHGGGDDPGNLVFLCIRHHLQALHDGYLRVVGRAGKRLTWCFGTKEAWTTIQDDDVRKLVGREREEVLARMGVRERRAVQEAVA